jgi:hypothetical protein
MSAYVLFHFLRTQEIVGQIQAHLQLHFTTTLAVGSGARKR